MNLEWIVTGAILFGAMIAGGISLYLKRKKEQNASLGKSDDLRI
jgi:LPXTG-motif cell wall-anchored protein